jgi:hypothetical protein
VAGPDLVTVRQAGAMHLLAVDVGAVAAAHIHEHTFRRVDLHEEMHAREVAVLVRQPEMGPVGSADQEHVVADEREHLALVRSRRYLEGDTHRASTTLPPLSVSICLMDYGSFSRYPPVIHRRR